MWSRRCLPFAWFVINVLAAALGCSDCDREGCTLLDNRATQRGTGMAGVIAQKSDVVMNGCQECPLADTSLELWVLDAPVSDADAEEVVRQRPADVSSAASGKYIQALQPGPHILCVQRQCVVITLVADQTLTVNIKLRAEGSPGFFVGRKASGALEEEFGFSVHEFE